MRRKFGHGIKNCVGVFAQFFGIATAQFVDVPAKQFPSICFFSVRLPVPQRTATATFNARAHAVRDCERASDESDCLDWLGGRRSVKLVEEVLGLGSYGKTLTVLSMEMPPASDDDEEEEDEEANLMESWTPRFRR
jgi:hypothetical protein